MVPLPDEVSGWTIARNVVPRASPWSQPPSQREGERREGNKLSKSPSLSAVPFDTNHSEASGMASWSGEQERFVAF
jgi:hypothetical protein